jgi:hypothetical protein
MGVTDEERAAFKRSEMERIADLHPGVRELIERERRDERRATVERIRKQIASVQNPLPGEVPYAITFDLVTNILDAEADRE